MSDFNGTVLEPLPRFRNYVAMYKGRHTKPVLQQLWQEHKTGKTRWIEIETVTEAIEMVDELPIKRI